MIRVTYIDCDDFKKEHLVTHVLNQTNNSYRFLNIEEETITEVSNRFDIKIEKQVKDLTLEEIYRYGELKYGEIADVCITDQYMVYEYYNSDSEVYYVYSDEEVHYTYSDPIDIDDYIDITDLVKEDKRNG